MKIFVFVVLFLCAFEARAEEFCVVTQQVLDSLGARIHDCIEFDTWIGTSINSGMDRKTYLTTFVEKCRIMAKQLDKLSSGWHSLCKKLKDSPRKDLYEQVKSAIDNEGKTLAAYVKLDALTTNEGYMDDLKLMYRCREVSDSTFKVLQDQRSEICTQH